jgi:hypothetical protein
MWIWVGFMVFNGTFHNISVISWQSVLSVEEIGENHRHVASRELSAGCMNRAPQAQGGEIPRGEVPPPR